MTTLAQAAKIEQRLKTHSLVVAQLERMGMARESASKEAFRRMQQYPKRNHEMEWQDFFTAVEVEGYSLPHR